jgi:hypothetical protein
MKSLLIRSSIILIIVFSLTCNNKKQTSKPFNENPLIGTWNFISLIAKSNKGDVIYPYGENIFGRLMYNPEGNMSALLMHPERPNFLSGDPMNGTPAEIKTAFEKFDAYCGTYTINEQSSSVTHHVQGAKFPNWIGTKQIRHFKISNDTLRIKAPPILAYGVEWDMEAVLVKL